MSKLNEHEISKRCEGIYQELMYLDLLSNDLMYYFEEEFDELFKNQQYIRLTESTRAHFALKMTSIFKKDENYNIVSLNRIMLSQYKNSNWKDYISIPELQTIEKSIDDIFNSIPIQTIVRFRNKFYAHRDKNFNKTNLKTEQIEVHEKLKDLIVVFSKMATAIGHSFFFNANHFNLDFIVGESIKTFYDLDEAIREERKLKNEKISISKIDYIMYGKNEKHE